MEFLSATDQISAAQSLLQIIHNTEEELKKKCLNVDKEVQFNQWLFNKLDDMLSPRGFVFCSNKPNKDIYSNVSEYSMSQPDCVVYHINFVNKPEIVALTIQIDSDDNGSNSDVNVEDRGLYLHREWDAPLK